MEYIVSQAAQDRLMLFVKVDPGSIDLDPTHMRDVRNIGHLGTGSLELMVNDHETLKKALPFIEQSFETN